MASLQASALVSVVSSSCSLSYSSRKTSRLAIFRSSMSIPRLRKLIVSVPKIASRSAAPVRDPSLGLDSCRKEVSLIDENEMEKRTTRQSEEQEMRSLSVAEETKQLYAILEAVIDRAEMHKNIGEQRNNWNTLLLISINSITLSAAAMAGATSAFGALLALKLPSVILLSAAATMLVLMNKIQPCQLVEEQRNAARLFVQLRRRIETTLALGDVTKDTVDDFLRSTLALDRAYPLPLIGAMIEKFPKELEPAHWWPKPRNKAGNLNKPKVVATRGANRNGWDERLEREMREVIKVMRTKDAEDYERLGNTALKLNKVLAASGPVLTGFAALAATLISGRNGWAPVATVTCAALATIVNALEHGGQVGMVFEMYRNTAGVFSELEESIESTLAESDAEMRENGELFEMKVAMKLGRSLSELRDLATKSRALGEEGIMVDEFASKIF